MLKLFFVRVAGSRWLNGITSNMTRQLWPKLNVKISKHLNLLDTGIITGHGLMRFHLIIVGYHSNDFCPSCREEEEAETIEHYLCTRYGSITREDEGMNLSSDITMVLLAYPS